MTDRKAEIVDEQIRTTSSSRAAVRALQTACVLVIALFIASSPVCAQSTDNLADSPTVAESWSRLTSENLGLAERAAAATALLQMRNEEGNNALILALTTQQSRIGWRAVIQAVATYPDNPPKELAQPLIGLLGQVDAGLADDLAAALGRFDQSEVIRELQKIAESDKEPVARRCGAILTLGHDRTTQTAGLLMKLIDVKEPELVQQASFKALGILSALDHYDADRQAWENWWAQNKGLWAKEWTQHLLDNFERRESRRRAHDHQLEDKLLESQRALYQANSPQGRPDVLVYMLRDPLTPIRQLGMDLSRQRLLDDLPFEEPLREALRARLTDPVPSIRVDAALRLRDLSDVPAAQLIAARLGEEQEQVSSVLSAYLRVMARLPQPEAIDPAAEFLNDEALRADAAASLAAAFDAGLMSKAQVNRAAKLSRKFVEDGRPPAPQVITLIGKVGNKDDWKDIVNWVDNTDPAVKQAAAQAWADSDRPLSELADKMDDPVIEPIVIAAATRRGKAAYTLNVLTAHKPQRERTAEAWRRALVAMAARVPADSVLITVRQVVELGESDRLRLEILTAAIDRPLADTLSPAERLELMLTRGEISLEAGDAAVSLSDFMTVTAAESNLSPTQIDRLARGMTRAYLQLGQMDQAFATARKLLTPAGRGVSATDDRLVEQFIETAQRFRRDGKKSEVARIVTDLRDMLKPAIKPEVGQQLAMLEAWVNGSADEESDDAEATTVEAPEPTTGNGPAAE
ncbi:MAG: hypothetical protein R3C45_14765 [Phycisphaerales bacterium]